MEDNDREAEVRMELGGGGRCTEVWCGGQRQKMEIGGGSRRAEQRQGLGVEAVSMEFGGGSR